MVQRVSTVCTDGHVRGTGKNSLLQECWCSFDPESVLLLFPLIQGMPGVWDMHCQYEANGPGLGQFPDLVSCSAHGKSPAWTPCSRAHASRPHEHPTESQQSSQVTTSSYSTSARSTRTIV